MVKSLVPEGGTSLMSLENDASMAKRQKRKVDEQRRLQKRAAVVADIRPAAKLETTPRKAEKAAPSSAPRGAMTASGSSTASPTLVEKNAYSFSLHVIHLVSSEQRDSRELKLRRAFAFPSRAEEEIRASVKCLNGPSYFKSILRQKAKAIEKHPVYHKSVFLTPVAFESWKKSEQQRIETAKIQVKQLASGTTANPPPSDAQARIWLKIAEARGLQSRSEAAGGVLNKIANATILAGRASHEPYVVVKLGKQRFQTEKLKNVTNPTWNSEFIIDVPLLDESDAGNVSDGAEVRISVWHQISGYPDVKLGQVVLKISDLKLKRFEDDWFDLDKPDTKSKRRRSSSGSRSRAERQSAMPSATLAESARGEIKIAYGYVPLQGVDAVQEKSPHEENFNALYNLLLEKLIAADNANEIRPFAQKLLDSRKRGASKPEAMEQKGEKKTEIDDYEDLADSLSDTSDEEPERVAARPNLQKPQPDVLRASTGSTGSNSESPSSGSSVAITRFNLSPVAQSILDDFSALYCVPRHFVDLCLLEVLGKYGDSADHLKQVCAFRALYPRLLFLTTFSVRILETYSSTAQRVFSDAELTRFDSVKADIRKFIFESLDKFPTSFEKKPPPENPAEAAFAVAIRLFLFFYPEDSDIQLRSTIKHACTRCYDESKATHRSAPVPPGQSPLQTQLRILLELMDDLVDFVDEFLLYFASGYPEYARFLNTMAFPRLISSSVVRPMLH